MERAYFSTYHIGAGRYVVSMVVEAGSEIEPIPLTDPMTQTEAKAMCAKFKKIYAQGWKDSRIALGKKLVK